MKKFFICLSLMIGLTALPVASWALQFGYVDAGKLFKEYTETQKTKTYLESEKGKLQKTLDSKKKEVQDLDAKYMEIAKKLQDLRDAKKEAEAKNMEAQLKTQREALANANGELQKFFEESQKRLYELEDEKMGGLSKVLDERVDKVIQRIANAKKLEAVFEKRFCYFGGVDITDEVISILNAEGGTTAATQPAPTAAKKATKKNTD